MYLRTIYITQCIAFSSRVAIRQRFTKNECFAFFCQMIAYHLIAWFVICIHGLSMNKKGYGLRWIKNIQTWWYRAKNFDHVKQTKRWFPQYSIFTGSYINYHIYEMSGFSKSLNGFHKSMKRRYVLNYRLALTATTSTYRRKILKKENKIWRIKSWRDKWLSNAIKCNQNIL